VQLVQQAKQAALAHREALALQVFKAAQVPRASAALVPQDHKDHRVFKDQQVHLASMDPQVQLDWQAELVLQVFKVTALPGEVLGQVQLITEF
jgi:hypothetical protein